MADRYFVGGGDGNYGSTSNWSTTSGGAGGSSVPTASDAVICDGNSPATLTVNASARAALTLTTTGWTGTIVMDQTLTVSGSITLSATTTIGAGAGGYLRSAATGTVTTNGVSIPRYGTSGTSFTTTLGDTLTVTTDFNPSPNTSATHTFNSNGIVVSGSFTMSGTGTFLVGTSTLTFTGTGTWSHSSTGTLRLSTTINTAGTLTISGTVYYDTGTLTYTAGTVVTTGSTLNLFASTTLNVASVTWNNLTFGGGGSTFTLSAGVTCSGTLTINPSGSGFVQFSGAFDVTTTGSLTLGGNTNVFIQTTTARLVMSGTGTLSGVSSHFLRMPLRIDTAGTITLSGTVRFGNSGSNVGSVTYVAGTLAGSGTLQVVEGTTGFLDWGGADFPWTLSVITAGVTLLLNSGLVLPSGAQLNGLGTAASPATIKSNSGGTPRALTIEAGAVIDVGYVNFTDIDCSGGDTLWVFKGTRSNTTNISALTPYTSPLGTFAGGGGVSRARVQRGM